MELKEIWRVIKKRLVMIALITVVAGGTSGLLSRYVLTKEYTGTATLMVISRSSSDLLASMITGQQLVGTYTSLVTSRLVVGGVDARLGLHMPVLELAHMISAAPVAGTDLMTIQVTAPSPTWAAIVANAAAQETVAVLTRMQGQKNMDIINSAIPNPVPVSPHTRTNIAVAVVLGLMVGGALAFLLEYLDDSIRSEEDVKRLLNLPVLTVIPVIRVSGTMGAAVRPDDSGPSREAARRARATPSRMEGRG